MRRIGSLALVMLALVVPSALLLAACKRGDAPDAGPVRVAAASDLSEAFTDIGAAF